LLLKLLQRRKLLLSMQKLLLSMQKLLLRKRMLLLQRMMKMLQPHLLQKGGLLLQQRKLMQQVLLGCVMLQLLTQLLLQELLLLYALLLLLQELLLLLLLLQELLLLLLLLLLHMLVLGMQRLQLFAQQPELLAPHNIIPCKWQLPLQRASAQNTSTPNNCSASATASWLHLKIAQHVMRIAALHVRLLQKTGGGVRGDAGSAAAADVPVALVMWTAQSLQRCHGSSAQVAAVSGTRGEGVPLQEVTTGA
jgi:hypothetical protein